MGAFSGRFFRGYIVIGGGGDVMSSILESHFIRLMEGLDRSLLAPVRGCVRVCVCVCVSVLPSMAASKAKVVMTKVILVFRHAAHHCLWTLVCVCVSSLSAPALPLRLVMTLFLVHVHVRN